MHTLAEIPKSFRVYGVCNFCERSEYVDHHDLVERQGDMTIPYFRERVKCMACGERTQDIRIVGYRDY
jgi:hypothetical protein